jgi:hypothetical protein
MIAKKKIFTIFSLFVILSMAFGSVLAEDGLIFRRNVSMTPDLETEKAAIFMMDFYVPAQRSTGELYATDAIEGGIEYLLADGVTKAYEDRYYAKPLVTVYIDGETDATLGGDEDSAVFTIDGGIVLGKMDAFTAISLDDGVTWLRTNNSQSADLSSFNLANGTAYPGHVHHVVHQVFGDNILVAWNSKFCEGGTPLFSMTPTGVDDDPFTISWLADLENNYDKDAVYLYDLFGVGGPQKSIDYTEAGFPEVGEVPFSCVWTQRGKLVAGDDLATTTVVEATHVLWALPERLTSGTRDSNLAAVDCSSAGCMVTWQEDPEGLRPGTGLGSGEGWSGAVANAQTDIWYSHISAADFDKVFQPTEEPILGAITMTQYRDLQLLEMPKPYVPMAMPVRLTDNAKCRPAATLLTPSAPYCYIDFDTIDDVNVYNITTLTELTEPEVGSDFCASTAAWTNPGGVTMQVCVTDDGRVLVGRVAATRVRMNLKPYTRADSSKGAWIVMAAEETKAMGDVLIDPYGNPTDDPLDIGKDIWYYSFDPFMAGADEFMIEQGGVINQPSSCSPWTIYPDPDSAVCEPYEFFPMQTDPLNGAPFYLSEIARRFALTTNSVGASASSTSHLSGMLIYKQGIINQGGPADVMLRRLVTPEDFNPAVDNPYAFENLDCEEWADMSWVDSLGVVHTVNPNYLQGVCLSPAINITANTIVECQDGTTTLYGNDTCADAFPVADDGSIPDDVTAFPRVFEWRQLPYQATIEGGDPFTGDPNDDYDLDDQVWENPYDIAKGHRGFLDGDFVMITYAWSPNWKSNSVGNDHYNFYVRRSFDGGVTWITTPAFKGGIGVTVPEYFCVEDPTNCEPTNFTYGPGALEQGRNVSELIGNKVTVLDPRYSPTGGMKLYPTIRTDWLTANGFTFEGLPYPDDVARDMSKFFLAYETGDNTNAAEYMATPMDMLYSRATRWGDVYEKMEYDIGGEILWRWPWVEIDKEDLSGEASMLANPGGTFMYIVWNQWEEEYIVDEYGYEVLHIFESDMPFRRYMYLPDDSPISSRPVAYILSAPTIAFLGDTVTFIGSGMDADDPDGENNIQSYLWYSSLDGSLSSEAVFSTSSLSLGSHIISLVVIDDEGETSQAARVNVLVTDGTFRVDLPLLRK